MTRLIFATVLLTLPAGPLLAASPTTAPAASQPATTQPILWQPYRNAKPAGGVGKWQVFDLSGGHLMAGGTETVLLFDGDPLEAAKRMFAEDDRLFADLAKRLNARDGLEREAASAELKKNYARLYMHMARAMSDPGLAPEPRLRMKELLDELTLKAASGEVARLDLLTRMHPPK